MARASNYLRATTYVCNVQGEEFNVGREERGTYKWAIEIVEIVRTKKKKFMTIEKMFE